MLSGLVNKANRIPELQRQVQHNVAHGSPVYYAKPHGKLYVKSYYGFFAVGMAGVVFGSYTLIFGKPVRPGDE
ncbi:hypothetical protein QCA50_000883 [Cerrena zonata]|uniref:Uncharacterized protein n=1 Tax=Cerrena zonata TaxID=2478898 RepID=A0AAW0GY33_9APHY